MLVTFETPCFLKKNKRLFKDELFFSGVVRSCVGRHCFVGEGVGVIGDNFNASKKRSQVLLNHNASFLYAAKI